MKKQLIYGLLSLMALVGTGLTSCSNEEDFGQPDGQKVVLTINASKSVQSRTAFEEKDGNLLCTWTDNDALLVTDQSGKRLGVISLVDGAGNATALFRGEVDLTGNETVNLFYFGNNKPIPTDLSGGSYVLDLSRQDGSFASLAANDFMTQEVNVTLLNGEATGNALMLRRVAEGHFNLQLPDGVQLKTGDVVTISQPDGNFHVTPKIKYAGGESSVSQTENGTLTIAKTEDGNDIYVTIFPQTLTPTFTVTKDGTSYTATLDSHEWHQETFVRNSDGNGVPVANWTKTELPTDPGDFNNWGGDESYPSLGDPDWRKVGTSEGGWINNWYLDSTNDMGYAAPLTYAYNAIENGILTSCTWKNGAQAKYFQWGRWLGFPEYVANRWVTQLSYGGSGTGAYPRGINDLNSYQSYYTWDKYSLPTYAMCAGGTYNSMNPQRAVNSSIIFLCADNDYLTSGYSSYSWQQRSGNPCPDGYRIPTADEMYVFVPEKGLDSEGQFNGSHAEVKVINGQKYAVKWTVNSSAKTVSIASVATTQDEVTVNSSIFNEAKSIELHAKGFMYSEKAGCALNETLTDGTYVGGYWTSSLYEEKAGNALCVMVYIKGNKCQVALEEAPLTWGLCIMPIKDSKAKATPIKPWFPLGY